jgi:ADP-ribose pyrophosphatase YjhB (NUDIX family)
LEGNNVDKWYGSAGICINENFEVLMVKQGQPHEPKVWTIPSGGKEENESFEECCIREIFEETGYEVEISKKLHVKEGFTFGVSVEVHYYMVDIIGGTAKIQDPDELIYEIGWKSVGDIQTLEMSFPEDRNYLLNLIKETCQSK